MMVEHSKHANACQDTKEQSQQTSVPKRTESVSDDTLETPMDASEEYALELGDVLGRLSIDGMHPRLYADKMAGSIKAIGKLVTAGDLEKLHIEDEDPEGRDEALDRIEKEMGGWTQTDMSRKCLDYCRTNNDIRSDDQYISRMNEHIKTLKKLAGPGVVGLEEKVEYDAFGSIKEEMKGKPLSKLFEEFSERYPANWQKILGE